MTKVTVFGQEEAKKEEKKIEFIKRVFDAVVASTVYQPGDYDNVCLLGEFVDELDVIMAWDDNSNTKDIYLGHWNDGVV